MTHKDPRLSTLDGPPGSGKTTLLVKESGGWPENSAVVAYTRDAASELRRRGISRPAGTIHALTWPHVKAVANMPVYRRGPSADYKRRKIRGVNDPALRQWVQTAPSKSAKKMLQEMAAELHAWAPHRGAAPAWIWNPKFPRSLSHSIALARWLDRGAPRNPEAGDDAVWDLELGVMDEGQDAGALEMSAFLALVAPTGKALVVGDPGQAIFQESKGGKAGELPPAWRWAVENDILAQGFRCGQPLAQAASRVLRPFYNVDPETFCAQTHNTELELWDPANRPFGGGLVLGFSRRVVAQCIEDWGMTDVSITPATRTSESGELSVSTIHAAKGCQAKNCFLLPFSRPMMQKLRAEEPSVLKLCYTAMTRASSKLYLPLEMYLELQP